MQGVYPSPIPISGLHPADGLDNVQLLCFEGLLSFIGAMNDRAERDTSSWPKVSSS